MVVLPQLQPKFQPDLLDLPDLSNEYTCKFEIFALVFAFEVTLGLLSFI